MILGNEPDREKYYNLFLQLVLITRNSQHKNKNYKIEEISPFKKSHVIHLVKN